jgi:hypothetical protein
VARRAASSATGLRVHGHDREDLVDVLLGQFGHITAAARLEHHQAFGGQHLERLAQRRAADAVLQRQRLFVDPAAGLQFVGENAVRSRSATCS